MFGLYRREVRRTEFLSRELHRSELRMQYIIRQLSDEELERIGVKAFDRDAEDWAHQVIVRIDELTITANIAEHRMNGMSEAWVRRLWPNRK